MVVVEGFGTFNDTVRGFVGGPYSVKLQTEPFLPVLPL